MSKIKNIKISDFRVYEGTEEFNFLSRDKIANLVALYAPNGYGKTSFFDAIEWAYSDKINRLEEKNLKKDIKGEDLFINDRIVLTNRNSYKKNNKIKGKVKIITEDKTLGKTVSLRKRNGSPIKDDYRAGLLSGDFTLNSIKNLPKTNILSQDQIDGFLRYKTPEEKFKDLKDFWSEGKDSIQKYEQLTNYISAVESELNNIECDIDDITKKIDMLTIPKEKIDGINSSINKFNNDEHVEFNAKKIGNDTTVEDYELLFKNNFLSKSKLEKKIESKTGCQSDLNWLIEHFDTQVSNNSNIEVLSKNINSLNEKWKLYIDLNAACESRSKLETELFKLKKSIDDYNYIIDKYRFYISKCEELEKLRTNNKSKLLTIDGFNFSISFNNRWRLKFERLKENLKKKRQDATAKKELINYNFNEFKRIEKENIQWQLDFKLVKEEKSNNTSSIELLQTQKRLISNIIDNNLWEHEYFDKDDCTKLTKTKSLTISEHVNRINSELLLKEKNYEMSGALNENLTKIKAWGENYAEETNVNKCPLCNSKFKTFHDLIESIQSEKDDVLKITEKKKEIDDLKLILGEFSSDKSKLEKKLSDFIEAEMAQLKVKIQTLQKNNDKAKNDEVEVCSKLKANNREIQRIVDFLKSIDSDNMELVDDTFTLLNENCNAYITYCESIIERIDSIRQKIIEKVNINSELKLTVESEINNNQNLILAIGIDDDYQRVNELLSIYNVKKECLNYVVLNEYVDTYIKEYDEKNEVLAYTMDVVFNINRLIDGDDNGVSEISIHGILAEKKSFRDELYTLTYKYKKTYVKYISDKDILMPNIIGKLSEITSELQLLNDRLDEIYKFESDVELVGIQTENKQLLNKLDELNIRLPLVIKAKEKLTNAQASCMAYIQDGIDNYFNKDVINQIYKRIEPHPNLKEINFIADVGRNGPRLLITAKGEMDEVNPSLYLSAGQVNVLSLSIFLAKAFEYGSDTISTIFMDDPIQNLSDINILSFIDLLRTFTTVHDKQIVISTHDEKFFRLLQHKMPEEYCDAKYLEFESEGRLKH